MNSIVTEENQEQTASVRTADVVMADGPPAPFQTSASPLTQTQMKDLAGRLASKNTMVLSVAESELFALNSAALTEFLAYERQQRSKKIKNIGIGFIAVLVFTLALQVWLKGTNMFIYYGAFSGMIGSASAFTKAYKSGVVALTRFESSASVGELIPALEIRDDSVQRTVRAALIRMLPQLRASDREMMSEANKKTIDRFLRGRLRVAKRSQDADAWMDTQLTIAILLALEQVGDNSFTDTVTDLAQGKGRGEDPAIAAAARECLPYLAQRTQERIASKELVRASDVNSIGDADNLLRAVTAQADDHRDELLRAGEAATDPRAN